MTPKKKPKSASWYKRKLNELMKVLERAKERNGERERQHASDGEHCQAARYREASASYATVSNWIKEHIKGKE